MLQLITRFVKRYEVDKINNNAVVYVEKLDIIDVNTRRIRNLLYSRK
jgi:hypothetical protein